MTRRSSRTTTRGVLLAVGATLAAVSPALAAERSLLASGPQWRLSEERTGDRHCLAYTTRGSTYGVPDSVRTFRERHCKRVPLADRKLDVDVWLPGCTSTPGALFLSAGPEVAKINASRLGRKPFALRRYALRRAAGHAFVLRRDLSHRRGTLTSYDAAGNRLAQVSWQPFPAPACAGPPAQPVPAP